MTSPLARFSLTLDERPLADWRLSRYFFSSLFRLHVNVHTWTGGEQCPGPWQQHTVAFIFNFELTFPCCSPFWVSPARAIPASISIVMKMKTFPSSSFWLYTFSFSSAMTFVIRKNIYVCIPPPNNIIVAQHLPFLSRPRPLSSSFLWWMVEAEWVSASERKKKVFSSFILLLLLLPFTPTMYKTFVFYASAKIINNMQCDNTEKRRRWRWGREGGEIGGGKTKNFSFSLLPLLLCYKMSDFPCEKPGEKGGRRRSHGRANESSNTQMTLSRGRRRSTSWQSESLLLSARSLLALSGEWVYLHDTDEDKFDLLARLWMLLSLLCGV